ncbi:3-carboxy-cis,cis-muconate cycloisomerase [Streptomyces sp. UNOC14_S4]|uniref:3-carboxy-cis,cis-muconate cycloisomerase n=1 Tax=Streptomyces sp. UNOC14_S4 TaxID=2872340 RepID=UPI001E43E06C|nr:3-carboxy-cis,cis-muconate cycloisomerase [Streptomyces sp. UNOC14_S4]MCC3768066.1 3-carboxy-cis,cis-muconate cycloisomerase [Streptomyces sp. UNOC14_S4]
MVELIDSGLLSPVRAGTAVETAVGDRAFLQAMLDAEAALARAQARLGTVPPSAAEVITRVADAGRFDLRALALAARETANPVVAMVKELTRAVAAVDPAAAEYVHQGSTSQDIVDTGVMLVAARALRIIRADLARTDAALAALAARHRDTPMAGRTLALQAVPTTFGLKAAGWRQLVVDACRRIDPVLAAGLPTSLGGAAGTLAGYLEQGRLGGRFRQDPQGYAEALEEAFAAETGLVRSVLPWHSLRTPMADLAAVLSFTAAGLGKMAVDVQNLTRTEVGEVTEPSVSGRGGSSAMPHKRNPVLATLIRTAAIQVPVFATAVVQCLVAEDERSGGGWQAEWQPLRECLRLVGGAAFTAAELAEGLRAHPHQMLGNLSLTAGQVVSERLSIRLAAELGREKAKRLVSDASTKAGADGRPLHTVLAEQPELQGLFDPEELVGLCDPAEYTGAAPFLVDRALDGTVGEGERARPSAG